MTSRLRRATGRAVATIALSALVAALPSAASGAVTPKVSWSDRDVVAGATVRAVVEGSTRPPDSRLVLQRRYLDGWRTADKKAVESKKGYVLQVPTDQFGSFSYRVVAKRGSGKVVSRSAAATINVRPPYDPRGRRTQHVFASQPRVRWDSCRTIRWTFNPRKSPTNALQQVREGFRRIHLATGLDFDYAGTTDQKPNPYGNNLDGADVIIGWRTAKDFGPFARDPDTLGLGGNTYYSGYQEADGTAVHLAVNGGVVLNASRRARCRTGSARASPGARW